MILNLNPAIGVTKDSSNKVSAWDSQLVTAQATQATGAIQPTWVGNAFVNLPSIRFNGSSTYLDLPAIYPGGFSFSKKLTMMVAFLKSGSTDNRIISPRGTFGTAGPMLAAGYSVTDKIGGVSESQGSVANSVNDTVTTANGTYRVLGVTWDGTNTKAWVNGTLRNTQALNSPNVTGASNNTNNWTIGTCIYTGSPGSYFNGDVLMLCAWSIAFTDEQMATAFRGFQLFNQY